VLKLGEIISGEIVSGEMSAEIRSGVCRCLDKFLLKLGEVSTEDRRDVC
jgi:hypothetical protein